MKAPTLKRHAAPADSLGLFSCLELFTNLAWLLSRVSGVQTALWAHWRPLLYTGQSPVISTLVMTADYFGCFLSIGVQRVYGKEALMMAPSLQA